MDAAALSERAADDSVSTDRLTETVVDALEGDEVPHYLLLGESLDVTRGGATERVYPNVDGVVSAVVTARRVLVVVPKVLDSRVEAASIDAVTVASTGDGQFDDLAVELPDRRLLVNARSGEDPDGFVAMVERQRNEARERQAARTDEDVGSGSASRSGSGSGSGSDTAADTGPTAGRSVGDGGSATRPDDAAVDPLERIERLAELNDKGVITDAEFQEKKQDLLDQV